MIEPINLQLYYSKKEIIQSYRFHYSNKASVKRDLFIALFCFLTGGFLWWYFGYLFFLTLIFCVGSVYLLLPALTNFIIPEIIYFRNSDLKTPYKIAFCDENITISTSAGTVEKKWHHYDEVLENTTLFLLYFGSQQFTIIPKRVFLNLSVQAEFRKLLKQKIRNFNG